ncbi:3-phosphoshikimate 1-carboxyvinyltransferase [Pseudomarimonas salicorniae]|uniref:3-phosphoshikimate 1-carboxyvinyltransferase n=1 Tax=Pseudomarimonas salicorniae TaxID=2933270 RepID=A0ABT0GK21_9GAMM|nr:3-phosphoshikimate 1-carboxyvinyltransferase [Lysobacter sp. CAU 1642]MCK7594889.1 3-phosphoshikimate 1-carboxyvinyltransferase [Lysobacter sp. CAU 1642]
MLTWIASQGGPLRGELRVPGDKSVSHRAIMLASLAEGVSRIEGFLEGEDTRATAAAFRAMGVRIESPSDGARIVHGVGLRGLSAPAADIDCGNAGTGMRLMAGVLAGQAFDSRLIGDASLSRRPMRRVTEPLARMGAQIDSEPGGLPPLRIHGGRVLRGIEYATPVASAQVKSAVLLAGLYAEGETVVREPHATRDYTERMLQAFGWPVEHREGEARLCGGGRLVARDIEVPADFSSAAFFIVAASVIPGSDLLLRDVGVHPRRTGLLRALRLMGADITLLDPRERQGEPIADLRVRHAALRGVEVPEDVVPDMIDEFPALFVAAALAEGRTRVSGAAELRVKESDRIGTMAQGLKALGARIEETPDGALIEGGTLDSGAVDSHGDHRIAMSFAIAGQRARGEVRIGDCDNVATSFPGFDALARGCGFGLREAVPG